MIGAYPFKEFQPLTPEQAVQAVALTMPTDRNPNGGKIEIYVTDRSEGEPNIGLIFAHGKYVGYGLGDDSELSVRVINMFEQCKGEAINSNSLIKMFESCIGDGTDEGWFMDGPSAPMKGPAGPAAPGLPESKRDQFNVILENINRKRR